MRGRRRGTGESGVSRADCLQRPEVQAYLEQVKHRIYARWVLPAERPRTSR